MYENFNSNNQYRAPRASEINNRVREQEKQMALMNARLHKGSSEENVKKTRNPFKALLGIFLAGF